MTDGVFASMLRVGEFYVSNKVDRVIIAQHTNTHSHMHAVEVALKSRKCTVAATLAEEFH